MGTAILADVLEERKEHDWDIPRRPEAIHLYGVDCMSTAGREPCHQLCLMHSMASPVLTCSLAWVAECLAYFSDWGPTFVEWIDDSSCNVLFEDDFTSKRALVGRGKPLPPEASGPDTAGARLLGLIPLSLGSLNS